MMDLYDLREDERPGWTMTIWGWRHDVSGYVVRRTVTLDQDEESLTPRYEAWAIQTPAGNRMRPVFKTLDEARAYVEAMG